MHSSQISHHQPLQTHAAFTRQNHVKPQPQQAANANARASGDFVVLSREAVAKAKASQQTGQPSGIQPKAHALPNAGPTKAHATHAQPIEAAATTSNEPVRTFGASDLESIRETFGAKAGDERYRAGADADGNGVIDFQDYTRVLANWGKPRI